MAGCRCGRGALPPPSPEGARLPAAQNPSRMHTVGHAAQEQNCSSQPTRHGTALGMTGEVGRRGGGGVHSQLCKYGTQAPHPIATRAVGAGMGAKTQWEAGAGTGAKTHQPAPRCGHHRGNGLCKYGTQMQHPTPTCTHQPNGWWEQGWLDTQKDRDAKRSLASAPGKLATAFCLNRRQRLQEHAFASHRNPLTFLRVHRPTQTLPMTQ
jgi:hypothetical protein